MHEYHAPTDLVFYAEVGRNAVGCLSATIPLSPENHDTIAQNNVTSIYPSDLTV